MSDKSQNNKDVTEYIAPVESDYQYIEVTVQFDEEEVKKKIKEYCANKNCIDGLKTYILSFNKNNKIKVREILAAALENKEEWDIPNYYWSLDFGIPAVGLTGEYFSEKLAENLKKRCNFWENNFVQSVNSLSSIYSLVRDSVWKENGLDIKNNLFFGISLLLDSQCAKKFSELSFLSFKEISKDLLEYLFKENSNYCISLIKALYVSQKVGYAVVPIGNFLHFIGEDEVKIPFDDIELIKIIRNNQNEIFKEMIDNIQKDNVQKKIHTVGHNKVNKFNKRRV